MGKKIQPKFNVLLWNINHDDIEYYDIIPYLVECYKNLKPKNKRYTSSSQYKIPETFDEFKKFIISESRYRFWARCEYEIVVTGFPASKKSKKIDAFDQIESNIDVITGIFMNYVL